jgi:drug/metabolite transporter (DMT)-like permease
MILPLASVFICAISRSILNVYDRVLFTKQSENFTKNLLLNAILPLFIALITSFIFGERSRFVFSFLMKPGIILSALSAQLAAALFSYSLSKMQVKTVILATKAADVFIPLTILLITKEINLSEQYFPLISTAIFIPIMITMIKEKSEFHLYTSLGLIITLCIQAGINQYFAIGKLADSWSKFLSMIVCIILWRSLFTVIPYLKNKSYKKSEKPIKLLQMASYRNLILRSFLAFIAQASFFYSITYLSSSLCWVLLNITPLISCLIAHFFLNEKLNKKEKNSFIILSITSLIYIIIHWSLTCKLSTPL